MLKIKEFLRNKFFKFDYLKDWWKIVEEINGLENKFEKIQDLKSAFNDLKERYLKGESLDDLLKEAFALVREASKRTLGQRHFDVQLLGGIGLHKGMVVEMMTGEGKTLTATLAAALNAIEGKGVHIVTVNDYLAQRDTVWMGKIYDALGLKVGCLIHEKSFQYVPEKEIQHQLSLEESLSSFKVFHEHLKEISRKEAYGLDIIYGTNHEFGFDYLRDNLVYRPEDIVQRELNYAIIDEVDSILIDEARTPLIIGSYELEDFRAYYLFDEIVKKLKANEDFVIDEKRKNAYLKEEGIRKIEEILGYNPYELGDVRTIHHIELALRANYCFFKDRDYVVKNNEVIIVDEFTGRLMFGRRWSGGLHQAIEAKEKVPIRPEMRTTATITIQNFFRKYKKLSGMTGTAYTSREEFLKVYGLEVVVIPPNKPCIRKDHYDLVYLKEEAKWRAIVNKVKELYQQKRPVLIGTISIEKNELLSKMLSEENIHHQVLNAKNHEREAEIIAQAGKLGSVTVATNMAGRGVDIILGGNPPDEEERKKVIELGGLFVIGTERHESRRIDNQLRGRAGRQGDPGETQFFLSLEDDIIRIFGGEKVKRLIEKFNFKEDEPIQHKVIHKVIEEAQKKVEGFNFDIRKHLLEYDDVINAQREKIYSERRKILLEEIDPLEFVKKSIEHLEAHTEGESFLKRIFGEKRPLDFINEHFNQLKENLKLNGSSDPEKDLKNIIKIIILRLYDFLWIEHLHYLEELKQSVSYRAYGQREPLVEYKEEASKAFENFHYLLEINLIQEILKFEIKKPEVGRNDPCPCGSGKKYKKCHGQ